MAVLPSTMFGLWDAEVYTEVTCKFFELLRTSVIIMSTFILVLIAIDRFLILCFIPSIRIKHFHLKLIITAIVICALALGTPPALSVSVLLQDDTGQIIDPGLRMCQKLDLLVTSENIEIYWKGIAIMYLVVILIISFCYTSIFISIYSRRHRFQRRINRRNHDR